jgi:hypothetical protein
MTKPTTQAAHSGTCPSDCSPSAFRSLYLCEIPEQAPACPNCKRGRLREQPLGLMCEGDPRHGVDRCGYKSWRHVENAALTGRSGRRAEGSTNAPAGEAALFRRKAPGQGCERSERRIPGGAAARNVVNQTLARMRQ